MVPCVSAVDEPASRWVNLAWAYRMRWMFRSSGWSGIQMQQAVASGSGGGEGHVRHNALNALGLDTRRDRTDDRRAAC